MQAGRLRRPVLLQEKDVQRDSGIGEEVVTWTTIATLHADVIPLRGREFFAAQQIQSSVEIRVRCRYRTNISTDMRVVWRGVPYDITAIIPIEGDTREIELLCASGIHDAK